MGKFEILAKQASENANEIPSFSERRWKKKKGYRNVARTNGSQILFPQSQPSPHANSFFCINACLPDATKFYPRLKTLRKKTHSNQWATMDRNPPSHPPHIQEPNYSDDESVLIHWHSPQREDILPLSIEHLRSTASNRYTFVDSGGNSYSIYLPRNMTCRRMPEPDCSGTCKVLRDMIHGNGSFCADSFFEDTFYILLLRAYSFIMYLILVCR